MIEKRILKNGSVRWKARIKSGGMVVAQQTFRLKGDAETWEREQIRALQLGTFLPPQKAKTPLGEVVASFLAARTSQISAHSHRTDRDNLAAVPSKLRARPIGSISEADVLNFLTDQLKTKERSTVARMRTTLSALFTYAMREKYIATHPVRGLELPPGASQKPADEWFTAETLATTLEAQRTTSAHYATITEWTSRQACAGPRPGRCGWPTSRTSHSRLCGCGVRSPKATTRRHPRPPMVSAPCRSPTEPGRSPARQQPRSVRRRICSQARGGGSCG